MTTNIDEDVDQILSVVYDRLTDFNSDGRKRKFTEYLRSCIDRYDEDEPTGAAPGILDTISEFCGDSPIRRDGDRDLLDNTAESDEVLDQRYRESLQPLANKCVESLRASKGVYYSSVVQCENEESVEIFAEKLRRLAFDSYRGRLLFIAEHDCHIHIIHECPYSNRTCRCSFIKEAQSDTNVKFRRSIRRGTRKPISSLSCTDWTNVLKYFNTEGRKTSWFVLQGQLEEVQSYDKDLESRRHRRGAFQSTLGTCYEGNDPELRGELKDLSTLSETGSGNHSVSTPKKRRMHQKHSEILTLIKKYPCCPVVNIVDHPVYLKNDNINYLRGDSQQVKNVVDIFAKTIMTWSISDFNDLYNEPGCYPVFSAGYGNAHEIYYDVEESIEILDNLLNFQFHHDPDIKHQFVSDLYNIIERNIPKTNTLLLFSPPSGGKNFFMDCFIDFLLSRGQLGRANKHNNFAFQDAYGKRIILWNEPNYESALIDQIKMMTAGDAYTVTVKCKQDAAVYKTPLIVLTNRVVSFMTDPAFKDRVIQYKWRAAPFLKDYSKKPNPLAVYPFFVKHGIIKEPDSLDALINEL